MEDYEKIKKQMEDYEKTKKSMEEARQKRIKERKEKEERSMEYYMKKWAEEGKELPKPIEPEKKRCDHPNTMEDSTATVLWIVVMVGGVIFVERWLIWIFATYFWLKHITR